jgi:hypothetical protein
MISDKTAALILCVLTLAACSDGSDSPAGTVEAS